MERRILQTAGLLVLASSLLAQVAEDPEDPNGVGIPYPFVHLVHSEDPTLEGTTAHLRKFFPFLFYQLGRDLVHRQYTLAQGAYGRAGELSVPLYSMQVRTPDDGEVPARFARDHASSCGMCHSIPAREPGAGQTIASTSSMGRNSPHFFGAGLVEMLAEQTRRRILDRYDRNHDGRLDRQEVAGPSPVLVPPAPGAPAVDYGDLSPGDDGVPRLNPAFRIWYLDEEGCPVAGAHSLDDPRVAGFDFALQAFGWGRGVHRLADGRELPEGAEATTLRGIFTAAAELHLGLQAHDPVQFAEPCGPGDGNPPGGIAATSINGARQYDLGEATDRGRARSAGGISLDDPDGDGKVSELTAGDLDAVEFYLLHAPAPAVRATPRSEAGRRLLVKLGCVRCHVERWRIEGRGESPGAPGDRRLFRLETRAAASPRENGPPQLTGKLVRSSAPVAGGGWEPAGAAWVVDRIYSDFKQWDLGPRFFERRYDGSLQRVHRTAPLWGVGSTAPYGHAGQFGTLEEVIAAHGGEAESARRAWQRLAEGPRRALVDYLKSLVLYPTEWIPADVDGDGRAAESFQVAGQKVGFERFDARFLFATPPRYEILYWVTDPLDHQVPLYFLQNVEELYGLHLDYRRDGDGDGFPDVLGPLGKEDEDAGR